MRKMISLLLALVLAVLCAVPAAAANAQFSDVPASHWAYNDVTACAQQGIVSGFADGTFRPNDNVSYIQFLVMLTRTFYQDDLNEITDTAGKPWYYPNAQVARNCNLYQDTEIASKGGWPQITVADNPINRYEMATIVCNTFLSQSLRGGMINIGPSSEEQNAAKSAISDWNSIPQSKQGDVKFCYAAGAITGMSDGSFAGTGNMTRAQACTVMMRMMKRLKGYVPESSNGEISVQPSQPAQPVQPAPAQPSQPQQTEQTGEKTLANGQPITTDNVIAIMNQVRDEYPSGTIWGDRNTPGTKSYTAGNNSVDVRNATGKFKTTKNLAISTVTGCGGFTAMVSDRIFGQSGFPAREVTDGSKIRPGDIVIAVNAQGQATHVSIVADMPFQEAGLSGTLYWCFKANDGNANGGYTSWAADAGDSWSVFDGHVRIYTRYPD